MSEQGITRTVLCTELIQALIKDNQEGFVFDFTVEDHEVKIGKNVAVWLQSVAGELTERSEKIQRSKAAKAAIDYALELKYSEDAVSFLLSWQRKDITSIREWFSKCPSECIEGME